MLLVNKYNVSNAVFYTHLHCPNDYRTKITACNRIEMLYKKSMSLLLLNIKRQTLQGDYILQVSCTPRLADEIVYFSSLRSCTYFE